MDKITLKFLADVLYIKGWICFEMFEDIMEAKIPDDLDDIVEKLIKGEYNVYRKGEGYIRYTNQSSE